MSDFRLMNILRAALETNSRLPPYCTYRTSPGARARSRDIYGDRARREARWCARGPADHDRSTRPWLRLAQSREGKAPAFSAIFTRFKGYERGSVLGPSNIAWRGVLQRDRRLDVASYTPLSRRISIVGRRAPRDFPSEGARRLAQLHRGRAKRPEAPLWVPSAALRFLRAHPPLHHILSHPRSNPSPRANFRHTVVLGSGRDLEEHTTRECRGMPRLPGLLQAADDETDILGA